MNLRGLLRTLPHRALEEPWDLSLTRWVYLRALGVVLLIAFVSFWVQMEGLAGDRGLMPVAETLARGSFWDRPSLAWFWPTSTMLHLLCAAGTLAALVVIWGRAVHLGLLVCWVAYLSLFYAAIRWLGFQWDLLLLEVTFLSIFLAPWRLQPRSIHDGQTPRYLVWLHRWIVARLMLSSGLGKLLSNDGTWTELTALDFHFWTQPIPNVPAWYVHQWGPNVHAALVVLTLFGQVVVPVFLFGPRRIRLLAGLLIMATQVGIVVTGNFAYFNLLTFALLILVFDDDALRWVLDVTGLRRRMAKRASPDPARAVLAPRGHRLAAVWVSAVVFVLSLLQVSGAARRDHHLPEIAFDVARAARPYRLVSGYGLFTRMTTSRPEIEIEGSDDGRTWKAYVFPFKPGPLDRPPPQVAPHQPRLDWQMWFAALGNVRRNPWLVRLLHRIQEQEPSVMALLEHDPFDGRPPKYLRAFTYAYRFTTSEERATSGNWWARREKGLYYGPIQTTEPPLGGRPQAATGRGTTR